MKEKIKQRIEIIKRGEVPKGYKRSKISLIPIDDWKEDLLGNLGIFYKGKGLPGIEMKDSGLPCIGYGDIYTKYNYHFSQAQNFVSEEIARESQPINRGTLLFTGSGETAVEIGKCVCYDGDEIIYAGGDIILFNTKKVNPLFIAYQQNITPCIKEKAQLGQGNSVVHIYADCLKKLTVTYPEEIIEQQRIVEILMKWDDAVRLQEKLVNKYERQKEFVILKALNKKRIGINSLLDLVEFYDERTTINNQHTILSSTQNGIVKQSEYFSKQTASQDNTGYKVVPKGYFTYRAMSDTNVFQFNIQDIVDRGIVSPVYPVFKATKINKTYLYLYLNYSNEMKKFILQNKEGSTRYALSENKLSSLLVSYPETDFQDKLEKVYCLMQKNIILQNQKLVKLKEQQKAIMHLLLTGIVRVNKL